MRKITTIVLEDTIIEGKMYSPYPTQINGCIKGDIISKESVTIEKDGEVNGNIKTEDVIISGKLNGNLIASGNVEITSTGRLFGNIISKDLDFTIDHEGIFNGKRLNVENEDIFEIKQNENLGDLKIKIKRPL